MMDDILQEHYILGGCPKIPFCCRRLQIPRASLARPKPPHRRHNYASGAFGLAALPEKFSLVLATKLFSESLLGISHHPNPDKKIRIWLI
ncbi:MAG: hypothetical protein JXC33_06725, partial [Deltaproteobacteria bacterium]|nr:hypothetical protein [Deltaproteobacteria bacterium]